MKLTINAGKQVIRYKIENNENADTSHKKHGMPSLH